MFRDLIPLLAKNWRVIAPDLPGFGHTTVEENAGFRFTFDALAGVISEFVNEIAVEKFAIYVFDYGAPVGFRLATQNTGRVTAIITQNGNAYEEGLSEGWNPIQTYRADPSETNRNALRAFLAPGTTKWQYTHGVSDPSKVSPDGYTMDQAFLDRPGIAEIQLDLFQDYKANVALYPKFQAWFRDNRPPLLAVWGKNDPFFLPPGAEAFRRDIPDAEVHLLDTGHFALETHHVEIASLIDDFLHRRLSPSRSTNSA